MSRVEPVRGKNCIYCGCTIFPDEEGDPFYHEQDCATITGLFPILPGDIAQPARCMACQATFEVGDFYVKRPLSEREVEASPFAAILGVLPMVAMASVCVGCGVDIDAED